jgi:hypothetical protein
MPKINTQQAIRKGFLAAAALALVAAAPSVFAQFGGFNGDAVIFMLTSTGKGGLTLASPATANSAANLNNFQIIDPSTVPVIPADQPGIFFPQYQLKVLHDGAKDKMQLLTNAMGMPTLHHMYLITFKLFTLNGVRREYGDVGEAIMDVPQNVYASFQKGQDIGPNEALETEQALVWTSTPAFPPFVPTPRGFHGTLNGPNETGTQLLLDSATFPVEVPWAPVYKQYPSQPWKDGFDIKFIEEDDVMGSVAQMIRIHAGTTTPTFKIDGDTHFYLVQGNVNITLAGGQTVPYPYFTYAFVPGGLAFSISNPRTYNGPTPTQ